MFSNLTDEQVETIEKMIQDAYIEGWDDADEHAEGDSWGRNNIRREDWDMSLAKNESCHVVAEKFMKSSSMVSGD